MVQQNQGFRPDSSRTTDADVPAAKASVQPATSSPAIQLNEANLERERVLFARVLAGKEMLVPESRGEKVKAMQSLLNEWRTAHGMQTISESGIYDSATRQAIKAFQAASAINTDGTVSEAKKDANGTRISGLETDGITGVRTLYALMVSCGRTLLTNFQSFVETTGGVYDISHVRQSFLASDLDIPNEVRIRLYEHVRKAGLSKEFLAENERIAQKHGVTGEELLVIYWGENRFKTGKHHPHSKTRTDTGLIGFTATPATEIGTSVEALARMSPEQQLVYVDKYLTMWERRLGTRFDSFADLYLAIHRPAKATAPDDAIVRVAGRRVRKDRVDELMFKRV